MKLIDNSLKSFQVKGKLPQWMFWGIALVLFAAAYYGVGVWARYTALNDLAMHEHIMDEYGVVYQQTDYSCVPASIVMLLHDQGIESTILEVATIARTDTFGTSPYGIKKAGNHFGYTVDRRHCTFSEFLQCNQPAVIMFRYNKIKHAAYAMPILETGIIQVKDPVQGFIYFQEGLANDYFGREKWDCFIFEREE